ncbi:MAG: RlmE family RNA methyltransferase [Desulfosalsimonadaceae bacterium]
MKKRKTDWGRPDHYAKKAKKDNYPARSVYKLEEIQKKFKVIRPKDRVLDLGCAPGSWLKYAAGIAGPGGSVVGLDLKDIGGGYPDNVSFYQCDILEMDAAVREAVGDGYNVVLSDMAPSTTGIRSVDAARSFVLCEAALEIAGEVLDPGGHFVAKIFQGDDFEAFVAAVKQQYKTRKIFKPQSCRKDSKEIYVIGMGKKQKGNG